MTETITVGSERTWSFSSYIENYSQIIAVILVANGITNNYDHRITLSSWAVNGNRITLNGYGDIDTYPDCKFAVLYKN